MVLHCSNILVPKAVCRASGLRTNFAGFRISVVEFRAWGRQDITVKAMGMDFDGRSLSP